MKIWDMKTAEQLHALTGHHKDAVVNVICSNTNLVLTGSSDGTVELWNRNNGKNVGMLLCGSGVCPAFRRRVHRLPGDIVGHQHPGDKWAGR